MTYKTNKNLTSSNPFHESEIAFTSGIMVIDEVAVCTAALTLAPRLIASHVGKVRRNFWALGLVFKLLLTSTPLHHAYREVLFLLEEHIPRTW